MKRLTALLLLLISIFALPGRAETGLIAVKGATLLEVSTGRQISNSAILVEGDRIKEVGHAANIVIPK